MKYASLYFKDILLGRLYENGDFRYIITDEFSDNMNIENVLHSLEMIKDIGKSDTFNYREFIDSYNNFEFSDNLKFIEDN